MSTSFPPPPSFEEPVNPYAAPEAQIGDAPIPMDDDLAKAEAIRRQYLTHEASVKSVGSLHYLSAIFIIFAIIIMVVGMMSMNGPNPMAGQAAVGLVGLAVYVVMGAVHLALGIGLTKLQTWARWVETALLSLSMVAVLLGSVTILIVGALPWPIVIGYGFGGLIIGYILYLLLSPKGSMVFSDEYKEIIARTPHIRYKSSCLMVFLIVFVVVLVVIGLFAFIGARR